MSQHDLAMKSVGPVEFADDDKGEIRAVVYTLGVVDNDGEVLLPKSFNGPTNVMISKYGHSSVLAHAKGGSNPVEPPVGKGTISAKMNGEIELVGQYFMNTQAGRDAYFTAKAMGTDQRWSFTFFRDKGEKPDQEWAAKGARRVWTNPIEPFEVSPVTIPGGVGTRTLAVRQADGDGGEEPEADALAAAVEDGTLVPVVVDEQPAVNAETDPVIPAEPVETPEAKAATEADVALKALQAEAREEFERVQRALKRNGYAA